MMKKTGLKHLSILLGLIGLSFLFHADSINQDIQGLHSWRQSQTMWNIRNFVRHDANILNPRTNVFNGGHDNIYRYEFPLMQWTIAQVQRITGERIAVVRLIMFLIGAFGVVGFYKLVKQQIGSEFMALSAAMLFQCSPIFFYYTFTPLPDILALTGGVWYLYYMLKFCRSSSFSNFALASLFLLLSTLAKLPFLMLGVVSVYYLYGLRNKVKFRMLASLTAIQLIILLPAFLWYAWVMPEWAGNPVLQGIFGDTFSWYEYVKLMGFHGVKMFPNKILSFPVWLPFILGAYALIKGGHPAKWLYSLIAITVLYLFLQLTTIGRDHDYYLFPFLPWLFMLVALGLEYIRQHWAAAGRIVIIAMCMLSAVYTIIVTSDWDSLEKTSFNNDVFNYSAELEGAVPDDELCIILNDPSRYIFSYRIDKMGYIFNNDNLTPDWVEDLIKNQGVSYMYSDSKKINRDTVFNQFIDTTIMTKGSVKVFKLETFRQE